MFQDPTDYLDDHVELPQPHIGCVLSTNRGIFHVLDVERCCCTGDIHNIFGVFDKGDGVLRKPQRLGDELLASAIVKKCAEGYIPAMKY